MIGCGWFSTIGAEEHFDEAQVARLQAAFVRLLEALSADAGGPAGRHDPQRTIRLTRRCSCA